MATKKIEKLTPEQEAAMPLYVEKWTAIGTATGPCDFEKAKAAAVKIYTAAGYPVPEIFRVAKSPIDAIKVIQELDPDLSASDIFYDMIFGNQEAPWLAFYDFFMTEVGVEGCEPIQGFFDLAEVCGWLNLLDEAVVFQDRPEYIKRDDEGLLHCENGPAIRYSDGLELFYWHNQNIPGEWITDSNALNAEICLKWENIEQRRCACEIYTWKRVLDELNPKVIDEDDDPMVGLLLEVELPDIGTERFLRVRCGTGRDFALPVPMEDDKQRSIDTALKANAWTYGFDVEDFVVPEVRT